MKKWKAYIIDDEIDARILLHDMLSKMIEIEVIGEAASYKEAIKLLEHGQPEVIFLDINLGDGNAFDLLRHIGERNFEVIFTTAYDHFGIAAFKANAVDYLLKPFNEEELSEALVRLKKTDANFSNLTNLKYMEQDLQQKRISRISVNNSEGTHYLLLDEVSCICSEGGNYTYLHFGSSEKKILISKNIGEFEYLSDVSDFFRIHQSYFVNLKYVRHLGKSEDGDLVVLKNGETLPLSRRKKDEFKERMAKFH